jgi:gluconate 2-dehydrogenase gamma chain
VIAAIPVASAALASAAVLGVAGCTSPASGSGGAYKFFSAHQGAVVEDATARLAPGPKDDPAEAGHPGAREAGVTHYIDTLLSVADTHPTQLAALSGTGRVPVIFAGGPWSNRHARGPDHMASFLGLDPVTAIAWHKRLTGWRKQYAHGVGTLDKLAGGDFTRASHARQDEILARSQVSGFMSLLFEHTIEGLYSVPEYGGNHDLVGWKDISYPGDSQPTGYTPDEVQRSDGPDPVADTGVVHDVLKFLGSL